MSHTDKRDPQSALAQALIQQGLMQGDSDEAHDRSLIRERLEWTAAQRLDANTAFLRFCLAARPDGPLVSDERP
jgi:hypothetical protein